MLCSVIGWHCTELLVLKLQKRTQLRFVLLYQQFENLSDITPCFITEKARLPMFKLFIRKHPLNLRSVTERIFSQSTILKVDPSFKIFPWIQCDGLCAVPRANSKVELVFFRQVKLMDDSDYEAG